MLSKRLKAYCVGDQFLEEGLGEALSWAINVALTSWAVSAILG